MKNIIIKVAPTKDVVLHIADIFDTKKATWLGQSVPASAAPHLARLQEIATSRILDTFPGATVIWSADSVHVMGGPQVHVSVDDDVDEGFQSALVEARANAIVGRAIADIVKAIIEGEE